MLANSKKFTDDTLIEKAVNKIKKASSPMIVAGGGAIYSGAENVIKEFSEKHGIPVTETFAEKDPSLLKPFNLGGIGATGTKGANEIAKNSDLVIGIGTDMEILQLHQSLYGKIKM